MIMKNLLNKIKKSRSGQLMIESLVAISIGTLGLIGFLSLLNQGFAINREIGNKYTANYLAAEGIELVKNVLDYNSENGLAWNNALPDGDYEFDYFDLLAYEADNTQGIPSAGPSLQWLRYNPNTGSYSYQSGNTTQFQRKINVTFQDVTLNAGSVCSAGNPNCNSSALATVKSTVYWDNGNESVTLEDLFYNWRQ